MRRCFLVVVGGLCFMSVIAFAQTPLFVGSARASQRAGTKLVDVYYDISGGRSPYSVTIEGSLDGGATWTLPMTSMSGDVGAGVLEGANRKATLDAGIAWTEDFSEQIRFQLKVSDRGSTPDGFALIPGGAFTMGRTSGDTDIDAPPVAVTVSAFYLGKYEVTKTLWDEVRAWGASQGYADLPSGEGNAADHPVHSISWYDMVKWCNARSEKEGYEPCYSVSGAVYRTGDNSTVECNWGAGGYRLPTEAEWEKAARGRISGKRFPWGTDTISHSQSNYFASGTDYGNLGGDGFHRRFTNVPNSPFSSPVGSFAPNDYGLYDMAGNMQEGCWDRGAQLYTAGAVDPKGATWSLLRAFRGGSWGAYAIACRATSRSGRLPANTSKHQGFRLARSSVPPLAETASIQSNFIAVDTRDADEDGIPKGWEEANGLSDSDADDGGDDTDGDGRTDRQEYFAGTDPRNAYSVLRIDQVAFLRSADTVNFRVSWIPIAGKRYRIARSSDLVRWTNIRIGLDAVPPLMTITDLVDPEEDKVFYRVMMDE